MPAEPRVSVIIVNYNSGRRLAKCLAALAEQSFSDFETIVIDNKSSDDSAAAAVSAQLDVTLLSKNENLGFAAGNNRAAEQARGEWLAFLNPDAYPEPDWLQRLMEAVERYPTVDAFGSTQIDALNPERLDGAGDAYFFAGAPYRGHWGWPVEQTPQYDGECFAPCAAAALFRRSAFAALGGFEERFFCYGEDVDLGFRLRLRGGRCIQVASAHVHHEGSAISGRRSDFTIYHGHRNRIWTYVRDMPLPLLAISAPVHLVLNVYLIGRFAISGELTPYLRALRDAVSGLEPFLRERRHLHANRGVRLADIAAVLTWSPWKMFRRAADLRPIAEPEPQVTDQHDR